ncbi:MAG: glutamate 5-kinase [Proteobacteria bacterium]|nr:glutamate 5-kinase [Pseudomonadota bacterium]
MTPARQRQKAARPECRRAKRIVVKVGSSTLADGGDVRGRVVSELCRQIAALQDDGREVVLVSSGAIAVGSHKLGWEQPGRTIPTLQAAAAVGQIGLMQLYQRRFERLGRAVGQVLVTRVGLEDRGRFLNARHCLLELLRLGALPIVNENDTVATDEIRFGDNDNLSATVVNLVAADLLVILTDVEGLHEARPPKSGPLPPLIPVVDRLTPEIERAASGSHTDFGRGGMTTKLEAVRSAAHSGAATVVCRGNRRDVLLDVAAGEPVGTLFRSGEKLASRKHWLAYTARTRGTLVVDPGAARALVDRGRSLLPAGVVDVQGRFDVGDAVACVEPGGRELARGLVAYSAAEVTRIQGRPTREIARVLGYSNGDEVIHRNDLVLVEPP